MRKSEDGEYEQKWMVLYQISRSGSVALDGGSLKSESNANSDPIPLETVVITSQGFGVENDSNAPELLVDQSAKKRKKQVDFRSGCVSGCCFGRFSVVEEKCSCR